MHTRITYSILTLCGTAVILATTSCRRHPSLFTLLSPSETGIRFKNTVQDSDSLNILDYLYFYNGGGVALGDINNDGLTDIFFTSNRNGNTLYLNEGHFRFRDITGKAGVKGAAEWTTGVTMADVNADGYLDIYVCAVGGYKTFNSVNQLYINNGNGTFTEEAAQYGLDLMGFNTQSVFFDYDHDGDLDMYLLQHSVHSNETYGDTSLRNAYSDVSGGKLLRNDGGHFTDVTRTSGIIASALGYGLGVAVGDLDNDGWEDIYQSNDFHEDDYYYHNNGNGTFTEMNKRAFGHESRFSMGNGIADLNNDGWLDVMTLDMLPEEEKVLKSSFSDDPLDIYEYKKKFGYNDQYSRNCLQLNTCGGMHFSDIALLGGVAATDWSWAPLVTDLDQDGIRDIFISNGIVRRPNDMDYAKYIANDSIARSLQGSRILDERVLKMMPPGKVHNYVFRGSDSLQFTNESEAWGMDAPTFSNGAAYADLDNDGDPDLVVNNINAPAGIYRNNSREITGNHYLKIRCRGSAGNTSGIGAKVVLKYHGRLQYDYVMTTRGFESSVPPSLLFGLGKDSVVDSLVVVWPDGRSQLLRKVKADRMLVLRQREATGRLQPLPAAAGPRTAMFRDLSSATDIPYRHEENAFTDFNRQLLIPHEASTEGPALAVGDVNGDGLEDFYAGGAKYQPGRLFIQTPDGKFRSSGNEAVFRQDSLCEDVDAVFFDADGNGSPDLYVVSGGNEFWGNAPALRDRLYLNDGQGRFTRSAGLPPFYGNKSCVEAADIDGDGDTDLFIGGRADSRDYGEIPDSYLLINDGKGRFTIATDSLAPGLRKAGMITGAAWSDLDRDGRPDLVVVGEWMPVLFFRNTGGRLQEATKKILPGNTRGWWRSILSADLNNDGFPDLLLGNYGTNSKLAPRPGQPLKLFINDFDGNGSSDQVLAHASGDGKYYTFLGKDVLEKQMPSLMRKKYTDYRSFAGQPLEQVFGGRLKDAKVLEASTFTSLVLVSDGKGGFIQKPLPFAAQVSPVEAFQAGDYNHDGEKDILIGGGFYGVLPYEGRYDANDGVVLLGDGEGGFRAAWPWETGFYLKGEVRRIRPVKTREGTLYLVARNNDSLQVFLNQ